ncbi:hypothetical protein [Nocardia sp. NPDC127526]|uniref:hypothetical protein n=1 Tax=Nocardia sp. NPDC127526 TaxID=3345393 RepID=UPI0036411DC2
MKIKKFAVTAFMAISAVAVTAGTAHGAPEAPAASAVTIVTAEEGVDHGVAFKSEMGSDGKLTTTVDGVFAVTADAISLADKNGAPVATIPLSHQVGEHKLTLSPVVSDNGHKLELINQSVPTGADISYAADQYRLQKAGQYAGIGALIGLLLGIPFFIGIIPGAAFGAIIGAIVGYTSPVPDEIENAGRPPA